MTAVLNAPSPLTRSAGGLRGRRVLPGFNLTLGYTLVYLSLIVLIPLSALVLKSLTLTWDQFWAAISSPRVLASYRLTFGASLIAALVNVVAGLLVAWVLVRYRFPGKRIVDALVDLPFALPTAVAGISLTALLAGNGRRAFPLPGPAPPLLGSPAPRRPPPPGPHSAPAFRSGRAGGRGCWGRRLRAPGAPRKRQGGGAPKRTVPPLRREFHGFLGGDHPARVGRFADST